MSIALILMALLGRPVSTVAAGPSRPDSEVVVLLHGLSRTALSMRPIEAALKREGYRVVNLRYPSDTRTIEELSEVLDGELARCRRSGARRIHFVAHSMGGIVVRHYLKTHASADIGRVVMLAPPNGGSELVDVLRKIPFIRDHPGPSRGQLGTGAASLPAQLGPVDFELGVIIGERSFSPTSLLIPGRDDGVVSVQRARVDGMKDFLVVPQGHTFIMRSSRVIEQTSRFLREGSFDHTAPGGGGRAHSR